MVRSRFLQAGAGALLLVTFVFAVSAACYDVGPCSLAATLDGSWDAFTVNGQPAAEYPLPFPSTDKLVSGSITFKTTEKEGSCSDLTATSGQAVARYALRGSNGQLKPPKQYVGRFKYLHGPKTLKLTAAGYTVSGSVSGDVMTLPISYALFGDETLVLKR